MSGGRSTRVLPPRGLISVVVSAIQPTWKLAVRVIAAIFAAALASFVLAGLLTSDSNPLWLNVLFQLGGFLGATIIVDRIAPQRALLAVAIGIGGTWGALAVWILLVGERRASAVIILCYVIASLALASVLDRFRSRAKRDDD
jgi:hypothetical protein